MPTPCQWCGMPATHTVGPDSEGACGTHAASYGWIHPYDLPKPMVASAATVKRPDLWGNVTDTFATETELNGHRLTQGRLLP